MPTRLTRSAVAPLLLALLLVVACQPASPQPVSTSPPATTPTPEVTIGAILDLGADAGASGSERWEALTLAVEQVNAAGGVLLPSGQRQPLRLQVYDVEGRPETVGIALRRLLDEDKAVAVLGPTGPEAIPLAVDLVERLEAPLLVLGDATTPPVTLGRWAYRFALSDADAVGGLVDFLTGSMVDRVGWLAPRTARAQTAREAFGRLAASRMTIVGDEIYPLGDDQIGPRAERLAQAGARVLVGWPESARDTAQLVSQAVGARLPLYLGPVAATSPLRADLAAYTLPTRVMATRLSVTGQLWNDDPLTPVTRRFDTTFRTRFGYPPTERAAVAWDAVRLLADTLGRTGVDRHALRDGLERTPDFAGAGGPLTLTPERHDGLDGRAFIVVRATASGWQIPP